MNADNFDELDRIDAILKKFPSKSIIGQAPRGVDRPDEGARKESNVFNPP